MNDYDMKRDESRRATLEAECQEALEAYFQRRPFLERTTQHERFFEDGFKRGWDRQEKLADKNRIE